MSLDDLFDDLPRVTVSQYTAAIKKTLEGSLPPCWVTGEISNFRRQASGHLYFSLKDAGAQIPAVMFRGQASRLRFKPVEGMQVLAFGEISVYEPHGRYQLIVRDLQESGEGKLYREFERLKRKLADEGLFDADRKKSLPSLPLKVSIVTSPTGAALQDFIRILERREWGGRLRVFPAKVQGAGADAEISEAIRYANELGDCDLIVVGRGGGSIEDLWSFNEEKVARVIAESRIPVISAVGHEIDFTLSDFAADLRAETPSAAAEIISSSYRETLERIQAARSEMDESVVARLREAAQALEFSRRALKAVAPQRSLEKAMLSVDELGFRFRSVFQSALRAKQDQLRAEEKRLLAIDVRGLLARSRDRLDRLEAKMDAAAVSQTRALASRLAVAGAAIRTMSPEATLKRGYSLLRDETGRLVSDVSRLKSGDSLKAELNSGRLGLRVESVEAAKRLRGDEDLL